MAIKQLLELIGDDIVIAKLDKVQKKGEETLASFSKSMPDLKVNIPDAKPIEDFGGQTIKLKDALHALRPILQASGIQFSEFGGLARLASTSLLGLAAATTGAVILGFAKLEENAAKAKGELADLFGGQAQGQKAFAALEGEASKFGTTVDNLVPGIESLKKALDAVADTKGFVALDVKDLPTQAGSLDKVTAAYGNFIKILRAGRLTQDEAQKSAKSFFDTFKDGGPVTVAALQALPVGSLQLLQQALGRGGQTAKTFFDEVKNGTIGIEQVNAALANFGPQAQTAFDTKAIHTFSDEIGKLLSTLSKGFAEATGKPFSDFVIGELKRIREGIESTLVDLKRLKEIDQATELPGIGKAVQTIRDFLSGKFISTQGFDEAGFADVGNLAAKAFGKGFVDASSSIQNLGAAGSTAGSKIAQSMDQASASIQKLRDTAKETGKEMDQIVIGSTRFKGRLDQIPVFEPQLAGEASDAAAKAAQKSFLDNPFFKEGATIPIKPEINKDAFEQNLETLKTIIEGKPIEIKPVVPTEAQQLLVQQFAETGQQAGTNFAQGIDCQCGIL